MHHYTKLRNWMDRLNLSTPELASLINVAPKTLRSRLNGRSEWTLKEMQKISYLFSAMTGMSPGDFPSMLFYSEPLTSTLDHQQFLNGGNR